MKLILLQGKPGAGKTHLASHLARELSCVFLSKDDMYDAVSRDIRAHESRNKICYDFLFRWLERQKHIDSSVILDYPFHEKSDIQIIKDFATKHNIELRSFVVTCSDEVEWKRRFEERIQNPQPNQWITSTDEVEKLYEGTFDTSGEWEMVIDTSCPVEDTVRAVRETLV